MALKSRTQNVKQNFRQLVVDSLGAGIGYTNYQYTQVAEDSTWTTSPRVNGKIALKPQSCNLQKAVCEFWSVPAIRSYTDTQVSPGSASVPIPLPADDSANFVKLENRASARFNGKLRKGSASLGVTAASWRQSRDMLVSRHQQVSRTVDSAYAYLRGNPGAVKRLRREREPLANQVLETEFGWFPLVQDIQDALVNVCSPISVPEYVTSRARTYISTETVSTTPFSHKLLQQWVGRQWVSYSAKVVVANQNLWLLNRLGLVNPATVAWDIIPWSFVVGMFVNVNQLIQSVSSEVGLSITDRSVTRGRVIRLNHQVTPLQTTKVGGSSSTLFRSRSRVLDTVPQVSLQLKVPELNWELALIASSLAVQKMQRINQLIRLI